MFKNFLLIITVSCILLSCGQSQSENNNLRVSSEKKELKLPTSTKGVNSDNENVLLQLQTDIQEKLKEYGKTDIQINIQKPETQHVQTSGQQSPVNQ